MDYLSGHANCNEDEDARGDASEDDASVNEDDASVSEDDASEDDASASEESPALGPQPETHPHVEKTKSKRKEVEMRDSSGGTFWKYGRFRPIDVWEMDEHHRIVVRCDEYGRPKRTCSTILASWLGTVARRHNLCPLTFNFRKSVRKSFGWRKLPDHFREEILRITKGEFDKFLLRSLGKKVKEYKYKLKKKAFAKSSNQEEIIRSVPKNVDPFQWAELVKYWFSLDAKKLSENGKVAREKVVSLHSTGTESFASAKDRFEHELGQPVGAVEFYHRAHVDKNGAFKDDDAASLVAKANAMLAERASEGSDQNRILMEQEVFLEIVGTKKSGHVRGYGLGVCPSKLYRPRHLNEDEVEKRVRARLEEEMKQQRDEMDANMRRMQEVINKLQADMHGFNMLQRFLMQDGNSMSGFQQFSTTGNIFGSLAAPPIPSVTPSVPIGNTFGGFVAPPIPSVAPSVPSAAPSIPSVAPSNPIKKRNLSASSSAASQSRATSSTAPPIPSFAPSNPRKQRKLNVDTSSSAASQSRATTSSTEVSKHSLKKATSSSSTTQIRHI